MTAAVTTRPGAAPSASPRGPECAGPDHLRTRLAQQICRSQLTGPALLALGRPVATAGGACAHQTIDAQGQRAMPAALAALGPAVSHHLAVTPAGLADRLNGLPAQGWDGLLALDLLGHLPDGPALLAALAALHRLLRDGGRVALDLAALEHAELVQGRPLGADTGAAPGGEALLRVADVLHAAVGLGLQPVLVRPYAAFTGGADAHPLVRNHTLERLHWWARLLSWIPQDESFTQLAGLLDEAVIARLGPGAAGRCLLVLERRARTDADAAAALVQPAGLAQGEQAQAVAAALAQRLLAGPRELKYFIELRDALRRLMPGLDLAPLLTPEARARVAEADARVALDTLSMDMIRGWRELPEPRALMTFDGLPLGDVNDYHMIQMLLIFGFKAFPDIKL